jgi:hypothetical protein
MASASRPNAILPAIPFFIAAPFFAQPNGAGKYTAAVESSNPLAFAPLTLGPS